MARLKSLKGELATRYDVREIGIFGSVARDENDSASDLHSQSIPFLNFLKRNPISTPYLT